MFTYRKATIDDVELLQNLNNEVFVDNAQYDEDLVLDWATSESGKKYFTALVQHPTAVCFLAFDAQKAVGYIAASHKPVDYRKKAYCEVENMGVVPSHRSSGIGSELMKRCSAWAKETGHQRLYVVSYFANKRAISFYKSCGFTEIDVSLEMDI